MRTVLMVMTAFLALTAVAGGIGLLGGTLTPDLDQLDGSPFGSYTIPAVVLLTIGLIATAAVTLQKLRHRFACTVAAAAGLTIMVYEAVQVVFIDFHWLQPAYFALGAAISIFAAAGMLKERRVDSSVVEQQNTSLV